MGFNIAIISTDTYQTAESHQILRDKGFTTAIRSLDRTPEGYKTLREAMMEHRISLIHYAKLENELIYLQYDTHTGKLDHPANGSKDISDSLAGAVWDLSLLPYTPVLHDFKMYSYEKEDKMPPSFKNGLFGGLQACDKTAFERNSDDWAFFDRLTQMH